MAALVPVSWCVRWWTDDGSLHDETSMEIVEAIGAWEATDVIRRRIMLRSEYPLRPFRLAFDATLASATSYVASYPAGFPDRHVLRTRLLEDGSPLALHDELLGHGATRLAVMIAFADAFHVELEELGDIVAAEAAIARRRERWERSYRLLEARETGANVAALLHDQEAAGVRKMELLQALRDAFGLRLSDAKELISLACDRDAAFDAELGQAIRRKP